MKILSEEEKKLFIEKHFGKEMFSKNITNTNSIMSLWTRVENYTH